MGAKAELLDDEEPAAGAKVVVLLVVGVNFELFIAVDAVLVLDGLVDELVEFEFIRPVEPEALEPVDAVVVLEVTIPIESACAHPAHRKAKIPTIDSDL